VFIFFNVICEDPQQPTDHIHFASNNLWSDAPCGPLDQQENDRRSDVLVFQTPVLDTHLALTGAINGHLWVSSDAIDTDFMVSHSYRFNCDLLTLLSVFFCSHCNFKFNCWL
jgi:predicted acyl esterase